MIRNVGCIAILTISLQYALHPGMMENARQTFFVERTLEKVYKNGVLERKLRLRSRLNTHLIYKK